VYREKDRERVCVCMSVYVCLIYVQLEEEKGREMHVQEVKCTDVSPSAFWAALECDSGTTGLLRIFFFFLE
jgi:hypothetical protein